MDKREDRWFVRSQGHTLGPLTAAAIEYSLKSGEILPSDSLCAPNESVWQKLSEHPRFSALAAALRQSSSLVVPPPPSVLWKKKRAPNAPPAAPPLPNSEAAAAKAADTPPAQPVKQLPAPAPARALVAAKPFTPAEPPRATAPLPPARKPRVLPEDSFPDPRRVAISLKAALQEWALEEERLERERQREKERHKKPAFELPPTREQTFFPAYTEAASRPAPAPAAQERVIRIEVKFPEWSRAGCLRAMAWLLALGMMTFAGYLAWQNKTRDLKDFRLPDPSSPTIEPSSASDPIPPLRAPTRPQRD